MIKKFNSFFIKNRFFGVVFIRLAFGFHLLYYSWDDVINLTAGDHAEFLNSLGIPFPAVMSWVYILTQFIGGIFIIVGLKTRLIAIPLIITFFVAYFLVHGSDPYKDAYPALQMLAVSLFFLFNGSGKVSIDDYLKVKKSGE